MRCKFHKLGAKEELHLLVRLLMSHALNIIVPRSDQASKKLVSSTRKGQYSLSDYLHAIEY